MKIISVNKLLKENASTLAAKAANVETMRSNSEHGLRKLGINPNTHNDDDKEVNKILTLSFASNSQRFMSRTQSKFILPEMKVVISRVQDPRNNDDALVTIANGKNKMLFRIKGLKDNVMIPERTPLNIEMIKVKGAFKRVDDMRYTQLGIRLPTIDTLNEAEKSKFRVVYFDAINNTSKRTI
jgi:hypothetical protein